MGTRHQELEHSVSLIWQYAEEACPPGHDLHGDILYGKNLVLAAPALLSALETVIRVLDESGIETLGCGLARAVLKQAKESPCTN